MNVRDINVGMKVVSKENGKEFTVISVGMYLDKKTSWCYCENENGELIEMSPESLQRATDKEPIDLHIEE